MTLVESKTFATHILDKHFYQLRSQKDEGALWRSD
jgi:hypothetical protein